MIRHGLVEVIGGCAVITAVVITGVKLAEKSPDVAGNILVATVSGYFGYVSKPLNDNSNNSDE